MQPWSKLPGFTKTYKNKVLVFHPHTIKRQVTVITGANGAGKTTYLKCLSGCIQTDKGYLNHEGALAINGSDLPGHLRVKTYLDMLLRFDKSVQKTLESLIRHFALTSFLNAPIKTLSTGMAQRVALTGAFLMRTRYILLDEPLRGLDEVYREKLTQWIEKEKVHCMIATHDKNAFKNLDCEVHAFESPH